MRIFDEQGKDAARAQMSYNLAVLAAILLPTGIGLGIAADVVASIVAGPAFREQFVRILPWLVLSGLIGGLRYYVSDMPLQLVRETGLLLWPSGMTLVLGVGLGVVLIPRYGIHGALIATNASQLIGLAVSLAVTRRVFRFIFPWRDLAKLAAAIVALVLAYRFVADIGDLAWKLAAMIAAAGAYVAVFVLLDGLGLRRHVMKRLRL
jgi:O-antigen/teichoic acid export membrane protein